MSDLVPIDTSAWVTFFQSRNQLAETVQALILENRVARCGMVELELRLGFKRDEAKLLDLVMACAELDTLATDFTSAGNALAQLRRNGRTLPPSDGLIAAVAVRHTVPFLADDKHFTYYPELERYEA